MSENGGVKTQDDVSEPKQGEEDIHVGARSVKAQNR